MKTLLYPSKINIYSPKSANLALNKAPLEGSSVINFDAKFAQNIMQICSIVQILFIFCTLQKIGAKKVLTLKCPDD